MRIAPHLRLPDATPAERAPAGDPLAHQALTVASASRARAVECALAAHSTAHAPDSSREIVLQLAAELRAIATGGIRIARARARDRARRHPGDVGDARRAMGRVLRVVHRTYLACARATDAESARVCGEARHTLADAAAELAGATLRLQSVLGVRDAGG